MFKAYSIGIYGELRLSADKAVFALRSIAYRLLQLTILHAILPSPSLHPCCLIKARALSWQCCRHRFYRFHLKTRALLSASHGRGMCLK